MTAWAATLCATASADEVLAALRARYLGMHSYRDYGVVRVWRPGSAPPLEMPFNTLSRTPKQLRFEFFYPHPVPNQPGTRYVVGCDGDSAYLLTRFPEQRAQLRTFPTLARAIGAASGISCGSVQTIAQLLLQDVPGIGIGDLGELQRHADSHIAGTPCYRISGHHRHAGTMELDIGVHDGLLYRLSKQAAGLQVEEIRERIEVDAPIDMHEFALPS